MKGILRGWYYIMASKFELEVETDHQSLKWIRQAKSPLFSGWVIKYLWPVPFTMHWLPGSKLVLADGISRVPVLPPTETVDLAAISAVRLLCLHLSGKIMDQIKRLWVYTSDTSEVKDVLKKYFKSAKLIVGPSTQRMMVNPDWDGAILAPSAETSPVVLRGMLAGARQFAVLIPLDLLHVAVLNVDPYILAQFKKCKHLVMARDCLTWVVMGFGFEHDQVTSKFLFSSELFTLAEEKFTLAEAYSGAIDMDQLGRAQEEQLPTLPEDGQGRLVKKRRCYTLGKCVWVPGTLVEKVRILLPPLS